MTSPYSSFPPASFWRQAISEVPPASVDPIVHTPPFRIGRSSRVMTAGSCFAQHIARYLNDAGSGVLITEPSHPVVPPNIAYAFNYGIFSARYGNIYTARQLLQLIERAYGRFQPREDLWEKDSRYIDPYRPRIQPDGFLSREEYKADRQRHFAAVRRAFEELDILVFTLGLTEAWRSREDGAVFPICPGVAGGMFQQDRHEFHNFSVTEVTEDLLLFINALRTLNEGAKVILTVSPVPLAATAEPHHVLVSTAYSKAVLRVASEMVCNLRENVVYFPSFEIVTGSFSRGAYFAPDGRSVTEEGVRHAMRIFFKHFTDHSTAPGDHLAKQSVAATELSDAETVVAVLCEEELLEAQREQQRAKRRRMRRMRHDTKVA